MTWIQGPPRRSPPRPGAWPCPATPAPSRACGISLPPRRSTWARSTSTAPTRGPSAGPGPIPLRTSGSAPGRSTRWRTCARREPCSPAGWRAAAAYAEWLAATYAHRGLTVHCICPQGVRTDMLAGSGRAGDVVLKGTAIEPEQVADALWDAMAKGRFLVLPHQEVLDYYQLRAANTDKWLRGMSRLQQRIEEAE